MSASTLASPAAPIRTNGLSPEDSLYEVVDGVRIDEPAMSAFACRIAARLYNQLRAAEEQGLGTVVIETLLILDAERDLRRRPDVAYISAARWPLDRELPETGDWEVVPDLCVEVVSPHDLFDTVTRKLQEYFALGVQEVWIVWPEEREAHIYRSREQFRILGETEVLKTELIPGLEIGLADLFHRLPTTRSTLRPSSP